MSKRLKTIKTALENKHKAMDAELNKSGLNRPREGRLFSWYLIFIFIALTICTAASGYSYYKGEEKQLREATNDQLSAVADLKVKQIAAWRDDRIEDATIILKQSSFVPFLHQCFYGHCDAAHEWSGVNREAQAGTERFQSTLHDTPGYSDEEIVQHGVLAEGIEVIQSPLRLRNWRKRYGEF